LASRLRKKVSLQIDARLYQNRLQYRELALIWLGLR